MGANYDKWVHDPIVQTEPPRFFKSDIAEVMNPPVSVTSRNIVNLSSPTFWDVINGVHLVVFIEKTLDSYFNISD